VDRRLFAADWCQKLILFVAHRLLLNRPPSGRGGSTTKKKEPDPDMPTLRAMLRRGASDPISQAVLFDEMMRLFSGNFSESICHVGMVIIVDPMGSLLCALGAEHMWNPSVTISQRLRVDV
jgi:hypothetical protein